MILGLSNHKSLEVGYYAGGLVDFLGLGSGIRFTPQGLKCVICFLCQKVKITKFSCYTINK